ncbi:hypothetical protein [Komagataeibacter xylinus]|uniref:hypothetical protein n=1 Tax=Komagataeibacter xylinus TaxID=28448 RepID=UPI001F5FBA0A|nr:hypothetical protein [Komagataeibacter xylinus]
MADLAEAGCASIGWPQRRSGTFFPCRLRRHSSRDKKVPALPSSAALRPLWGALPLASGWSIAIEATVVAAR